MRRHLLYLLLALAVLSTPAAFANTLTVKNLNDSGPNSLRQAIANASPGDTIIFNVTGTITLTSGQLEIAKNLTIQGPGTTSLTISGQDSVRVFQIDGGATVTLDRLTIAHGAAGDSGGGINNAGAVTVSNSVLSSNTASYGGGGISNAGTVTVSSSTLSGNSASFGGGILNVGTLTVSNSTLSGNTATAGGRAFVFGGGGIYNAGTVTVSNSILSGNSGFDGGGINNDHGTVTVSSSTLSSNSSGLFGGGGIYNDHGTVTVSNSTLSGNTAVELGGGIENFGTVTVSNSTLSGNSANQGGGIDNDYGATLTLGNTILANSPSGGNCYNLATMTSLGHNLSSDASCTGVLNQTGDQNNVDPLLGPLADNGGPTFTHALLAGSPALDAGDNTNAPATDQRGLTRIVNGTLDIGAYEIQTSADLTISISATPSPVKSGAPLLYSIIVQNLGPTGADGVVVSDTLPPNTTFLGASVTHGRLVTPPVGYTGMLTAYLGAVANGGSGSVTITVKVLAAKPGTVTNTATVSANTPDPFPSNNTVTVVTSVH